MRAPWIAVLVVIGCGPPPAPEPLPRMTGAPAQPPAEPEPSPPPAELPLAPAWQPDDQLRALWWSYPIDGTNYQRWADAIPADLRAPMAEQLLREGGFRCETIAVTHACGTTLTMANPSASADLGDPCLRRQLASWALDQITDPDTVAGLFSSLITLVRMPPPERDLGDKAIAKLALIGEGATALWEAEDAGNHALVERHLDLLDVHDLHTAIVDRHIDGALLALLPLADATSYALRFGAESRDFRTETRLAAITRMGELLEGAQPPHREALLESLRGISARKNCTLAGAAAAALASAGEPGVIERGPFRDSAHLLHAACQTLAAVGATGPAWKQLLTPHDLTVRNHLDDPLHVDALWTQFPFAYDDDADGAPDVPEADADHDGVASTRVEVQTVKAGRTRTLPFADELRLALPHCDDQLDCALPGTSVHFHLDIRKERGTRYRLHALDRYEHVGFDC